MFKILRSPQQITLSGPNAVLIALCTWKCFTENWFLTPQCKEELIMAKGSTSSLKYSAVTFAALHLDW